MPNNWENGYSMDPADNGSGSVTNGAAGDQDNDSSVNLDEYVADTNPNDSNSVFRTTWITANSPVSITWSSSADRVYQVDYNTNFAGESWSTLTSNHPGSNALISITDTNAASRRVYRLWVGFP